MLSTAFDWSGVPLTFSSQGTNVHQTEAVGITALLWGVWADGQADVVWQTTFFADRTARLLAILFFFEVSFPGPSWLDGQYFILGDIQSPETWHACKSNYRSWTPFWKCIGTSQGHRKRQTSVRQWILFGTFGQRMCASPQWLGPRIVCLVGNGLLQLATNECSWTPAHGGWPSKAGTWIHDF